MALADIMAEWEQEVGEKVARGWRRLQEVTWPGSSPRGLQRCRSVEILEAWTIAVIAPSYHDMVIHNTCLDTNKVTSHTIDDRLEHSNIWVSANIFSCYE